MQSTNVVQSLESARLERALHAAIASHLQNGHHKALPLPASPAAGDAEAQQKFLNILVPLLPVLFETVGDIVSTTVNHNNKRKDVAFSDVGAASASVDKKLLEDIGRALLDLAPIAIEAFRRKDLVLPGGASIAADAQDKVLPVLVPIILSTVGTLFNVLKKDISLDAGATSNGADKALFNDIVGALARIVPEVVRTVGAMARAA